MLKDVVSRFYTARRTEPGVAAVLACGMLSSTVAMLGTYPLNLVRTCLHVPLISIKLAHIPVHLSSSPSTLHLPLQVRTRLQASGMAGSTTYDAPHNCSQQQMPHLVP